MMLIDYLDYLWRYFYLMRLMKVMKLYLWKQSLQQKMVLKVISL